MKNKKGFTLIELLVVIVIISILVAIALPKYIDTVDIAFGKRAYDNMQMMYNAQQRFWTENVNAAGQHAFATTFDALDVRFPSATKINDTTLSFDKFNIYLQGTTFTTDVSIPNYKIVFDFSNETKQCIVASNANSVKGARVCRALGGKDTGSGVFDLI